MTETEKVVPEKLILLLERFEGSSLTLPAHTGIDDTVYGSLAIYQEEIVNELSVYMNNHSLEELEEAGVQSINALSESEAEKELHLNTWNEIKNRLKPFDWY